MAKDMSLLPGSIANAMEENGIVEEGTVKLACSPFANDKTAVYQTRISFPVHRQKMTHGVDVFHDNTQKGFANAFKDQILKRLDVYEKERDGTDLMNQYGISNDKELYHVWHRAYLLQKDMDRDLRRMKTNPLSKKKEKQKGKELKAQKGQSFEL